MPTHRQAEFLSALEKLHGQTGGPVRYGAVAKHVGVSKWSAYDMLCRLVDQGLARKEYLLDSGCRARGRSAVGFVPVRAAVSVAADQEVSEWAKIKERILRRLKRPKPEQGELLDDLVASLPTTESPLAYCGELLTALLLSVHDIKVRIAEHPLYQEVSHSIADVKARLATVAGLSVGLSGHESLDRRFSGRLAEYVCKYEDYVQRLGALKERILLDYCAEILGLLARNTA
jgi:hypothetical protein